MPQSVLPHLAAALNGGSLVFLLIGVVMAKRGRRACHRRAMMAAVAVGVLFIAAYLGHHAGAPITPFRGQGWLRPAYYTLLISHVLLAATLVPLALVVLRRARAGRFDSHRRLARRVMPLWVYVSISGIVVYMLLYHFPSAA